MALTNAERQARWREKHREINANNAVVTASNGAVTIEEPAPAIEPTAIEVLPQRRWNYPLVACGIALFGIAVSINVLNAWGPNFTKVVIYAVMGVVAEGVVFCLWPWLDVLRGTRKLLGVAAMVIFLGFALLNSMRMASIMSADQGQARTSEIAGHLDRCLPATTTTTKKGKTTTTTTVGESAGCAVVKANPGEVSPETKDFAALIAWLTFGNVTISEASFAMLWLLLRTLVPQLGGLVLLLARR